MEKIIIEGIPVYTSDKLKEQLKDFINKMGSPKSKQILIQLIDDGVIIPIINEPNILRKLIMWIRKQDNYLDRLYGFARGGKCYVIFAPNHSNKVLVDATLHEVIHVAHHQFPKKFNQLNMSIYLNFYSYFYKELFKADNYNVKEFIQFVEKLTTDRFYVDLLYMSIKDYTKLSDDEIENTFKDIIYTFKIRNFDRSKITFKIKMLLNASYRKLFNNIDYRAGVYQEIRNPGEIICVLSTINPEHPNVIKSLKMIESDKEPLITKVTKKIYKGKYLKNRLELINVISTKP
jgi:hypothetical protein